jgi:hypothetical protein
MFKDVQHMCIGSFKCQAQQVKPMAIHELSASKTPNRSLGSHHHTSTHAGVVCAQSPRVRACPLWARLSDHLRLGGLWALSCGSVCGREASRGRARVCVQLFFVARRVVCHMGVGVVGPFVGAIGIQRRGASCVHPWALASRGAAKVLLCFHERTSNLVARAGTNS